MALIWARLHPCPVDEVPAHWGEVDLHGESVCPLAGVGAPWVAEFAPADLGAALGISVDAAKQLLGDALELAHRLPRLWALVQDLAVPVWRARLIARETRDLSLEAAKFADRLIAATPDKIGSVHAARLVQEARLYFDPDRAIADEDEALAKRGVWSRPGAAPATTEMWMTLDTPDAELFDQSVSRVAGDLRQLGDTDSLDVRRARAVGILADPQYALDLMSGREGAAPTMGSGGVANLFVHLTPADLEADLHGGTGAASIEKLGAATTRLLTDWLTRLNETGGKVILRPGPRPHRRCRRDVRGPARPTRRDARASPAARRALRLPRLPPGLPGLRPGPHHPLRPDGRGRTTRPNPSRQSRTAVPDPPPGQDPHRLGLQEARRRRLRLDESHRAPVRHRHRRPTASLGSAPGHGSSHGTPTRHPADRARHPAPTPTNLTAPDPDPSPVGAIGTPRPLRRLVPVVVSRSMRQIHNHRPGPAGLHTTAGAGRAPHPPGGAGRAPDNPARVPAPQLLPPRTSRGACQPIGRSGRLVSPRSHGPAPGRLPVWRARG